MKPDLEYLGDPVEGTPGCNLDTPQIWGIGNGG